MKSRWDTVSAALDAAIPSETIVSELRKHLESREPSNGIVSIAVDEVAMSIPVDVDVALLEKALFSERYEGVFASGCRVTVALGRISLGALGLPRPLYCFARLFFCTECRCTRIEFRSTVYNV